MRHTFPLLQLFCALATCVCCALVLGVSRGEDPNSKLHSGLSPNEALRTFELPPNYRIELIAAEPLVQDPVAIEWGADGKLWVAEMADYPYGLDGKMSPGGRIRFLEDTDGDGKPDRSTVFLDKINFPTGVLPWRKGVLVTAAPDIFYAEDTDGDGRADTREVHFTGFKEGNPQLRVNGLQWGLDGWVYCANGWSGGEVRCLRTKETVDLKRLDFRIQPDSGELELIEGITEFGRNRDDWGNWFGCDNSNPAWHFVLQDRYLRRNPHVAPPDPRKQLLPTNPRVFARSELQKRYHSFEHSDRYTSGCAVTPYRDELLFADDAQHLFVCEPVHNLVQHLVLRHDQSSFVASVPEHRDGRDFLTSTDPWFRPVNLRTGPDGALWVVDMYRYMIEHPEWLPDEGKQELEPHYRKGEDRGRIYRVYHKDRPPRRWKPISGSGLSELCERLYSPNGWQRDVAAQQLLWRTRTGAIDAVAKVFQEAASAKARLHALSTLDRLGALEQSTILVALRDSHPMVRRAAVKLAEERLEREPVLAAVIGLANDPSDAVRLQVAFTLGESSDQRAAEGLAQILGGAGQDTYLAAAVFSSLGRDNLDAAFRSILASSTTESRAWHSAVELVALAAAVGRNDLCAEFFEGLAQNAPRYAAWHVEAADRWLRAVKGRKDQEPNDSRDDELFQKRVRQSIEPLLAWARSRAADRGAESDLRAACVRISLRNGTSPEQAIELATAALELRSPSSVQRAAVQEVSAFNPVEASRLLFGSWGSFGPAVRKEVLSAALSRPALSEELVARIEAGDISRAEIDAASRQRLLNANKDTIRRRAKLLFGDQTAGNRQAVIDEFEDLDLASADVGRGREVFLQKCATCHALDGQGHSVGPDLGALSDRSTPGLLTAILDPSRAIEPKYAVYQALTREGRVFSGILAVENATQIELIEQDNRRHVVPRTDIEELASSQQSLMPEGFEKDLTRQQLADLIGYLQKTGGVALAPK